MNIFLGSLIFLILPIALIIFIGFFFKRHPIKNSKSTNVFDQAKEFKDQYGGFKGRAVFYGFLFVFILVLVLRVANFF